jgi:predicted TIM-barrel fold metal-dependent hydrolase
MLERDVENTGTPSRDAKTRLRIIDCDIHPYLRTPRDLDPFLSARWRQHLAEYGKGTRGIYAARGTYPRFMPNTCRRDAWPPDGGLPGSHVDFIRTQHLDANDVEFGVLEPLLEGNAPRNIELQAALCSAFNDWQVTHFTDIEPRLRASILVPQDDAEAAVTEIEKRAADPRFAQIQLSSRTPEPLGRKRYWPIFATAERANLPIGLHVGGPSAAAPRPRAGPRSTSRSIRS